MTWHDVVFSVLIGVPVAAVVTVILIVADTDADAGCPGDWDSD